MNEPGLLNKMADIELPAAPDWQPYIIVIAITLLIVFITVMIIRNMYKSKKQYASSPADVKDGGSVLDEIEDQWSTGRIDDREASYRLSTLLRLGLGLPQLRPVCPADLIDDATAWEDTIQLFHQLRYKQTTQTRLSAEDFRYVKKWLMHTSGIGHHG